ncbi:MAG: alpha/beta hydrolase [Roseburia sp.]|nr:alpha/beta hydrolase [Roseburia sp.]
MQGWMVALLVIACVLVALSAAFVTGSLVAVHIILGRRKKMSAKNAKKKNYTAESFGVDISWFDEVADGTESRELTAYDGVKLCATLIKHAERAAKVAVCCHGYGASPRSMQPQAKIFYDMGFDVLLPSMRGHGASGGKVGMAWIDRFDVLRWIDKLIDIYGQDVSIALDGVSMGGSTVIAVAGMNPPPQVKCVIDDCGFSSQRDEYFACLGKVPLPKAVAMLPLAVGVKLVHGYSIYDADIVPFAQSMTMPALFIHGEKDAFVPFELGKKLYEACGSPQKKFYAVPDAVHACAYVYDPEKYAAELREFVGGVVA